MLVKKKREYKENKTCKAWLEWLYLQYPLAFRNVIKIDNEGTTNRAEAVRLGLHVGASDYFIAYPMHGYHGLWLEVKPEGWKLTPSKQAHYDNQIAFGAKMEAMGYRFFFCVGIDELINATRAYFANYSA